MTAKFKHILIIADIEGSSGCWNYQASRFLTPQWRQACYAMTRDVDTVARALFEAGVDSVTVKDFHRTGYNLLPERIDARTRIISGYRRGPVPGIGDPRPADAVIFLGLHAASGGEGFLAHTLTSRIRRITVDGRLLPELDLFAGALGPYGLTPVFFSGCPIACRQASERIPGIHTCTIDKTTHANRFDAVKWRQGLAQAAAGSLGNYAATPHCPDGPFRVVATMRDGNATAAKLSRRWGHRVKGPDIFIHADSMAALYLELVRLCYLRPIPEQWLSTALWLSNIRGRLGLAWVRAGREQTGLMDRPSEK